MDNEISKQVEQIKREWDEPVKSEPGLIFTGENITVEQALNRLRQELQNSNEYDPYSYFNVWQSNIAMAFYNAYVKQFNVLSGERHLARIAVIANEGAKNFLKLICSLPNNAELKKQYELPK